MLFSVKAPKRWFWRTGLTEEKVREELRRGNLTEDWLICPHGESHRAVFVREFFDDPNVLRADPFAYRAVRRSNWTCLKCGHQEFTESSIATHGTVGAKLFFSGVATRMIATMTCNECRFTEFYAD